MKDPSDNIRDWVYTALYGNVFYGGSAVAVYSFPTKDATMPYILIGEHYMTGEQGTKDAYITEHEVMVEIYASSTGNRASYAPVNSIADSIMQILRTRTSPVITGYTTVRCLLDNKITERIVNETNIIIYKSIQIRLLLEEN